ncbi:3-hydroxybutyryl-CoA dehydrogenase [Modestobacter sp. DSM 44400]|uniref:3-hydroxyacyl-CoA dehydrogenase family protein n=1 Tax=Modestobacter sp. DSM 44400 TaxID=1550230 RepID=UPI0008968BA8|nr:3-hydroxyacyl-CoA dehydrogenase NAD-binding domain-containing protein [Modestobacter sp. DSM 44400]SDY61514.1 3-hydroxybutyryl-CoA dehydrogenase [Modestobacter sp. DSM 44400]
MRSFQRVAVLGFGTMGSGIAQVVAASGRDVVVLETDQERLGHGSSAVQDFLDDGVRRGKATEADRDETLARITGTTVVVDLAGVDLVIEAVSERQDIKVELLGRVAEVVGEETVLATNTSALSVTDLAGHLARPERMAGLHFFNPAPVMALVEVVRALQTDGDVVTDLVAFVEAIGKSPVEVKDRPGFLVNRLLMPYLNDVVQEYDNELASAEDIDVAIQLGLGYKLGPLALLDLIGIDVHRHATEAAYETTLDPQFAPPPLLSQMVAAGYLGNKSGRGFRVGTEHGEVR